MIKRALVCAVVLLTACGDDDVSSVESTCDDACTQLLSCEDKSDADQCPGVCARTAEALAASDCKSSGTAAYRCIADKDVCDLDDDDGVCADELSAFSTCIGQLCANDRSSPLCLAE